MVHPFSSPPCGAMVLTSCDLAAGRVELSRHPAERVRGGFATLFGTAFAAHGARFLRLPLPFPFKLVPLAFVAIGAGVGAVGACSATASYVARVERRKGVTLRWRWGPLPPRELFVAEAEIEAFDVAYGKRYVKGTSSADDILPANDGYWVETYRLMLVTRQGNAVPIEDFKLGSLARMRKKLLEDALLSL